MKIQKKWAMPSHKTFTIKPINDLIVRYIKDDIVIVDPFANEFVFYDICKSKGAVAITNDLDSSYETDFNMDATDFLRQLDDECADLVLYDPPYSPRQVSEMYKKMDMTVNMQTTQASYWSNQKKEIARITRSGGHVISCSWNSGGIGKKYGFIQEEILLVAHGGWHNDTIVVCEKKVN